MTSLNGIALKNFIKKAIYVWTGICSMVFGLVAGILPLVPGILFIFVGIILISKGSPAFKNFFIMQMILTKTKTHLENSSNRYFKKLLMFL